MIHLITELSKYVMIILFAIYTWYSYVVLVIKNEERQKRMYKAQTTCMFLIHLDAFMVLFAVTKDFKILIFYGAQVLFVLFLFLIYRIIYKRAARLVVNHMCMLLLVGFIILTRLNFENAIRQFEIAVVAAVVSAFVPILVRKLKFLRKFTWFYCAVGVVALGIVLVLGKMSGGAHLSFTVAGITLQPSEFVKIIFVFFVACMLYEATDFRQVCITTVAAAVHVGILVLSTDLGAALIFFLTYVVMLYVATRKPVYFFGGLGVGCQVLSCFLMYGCESKHGKILLPPFMAADGRWHRHCLPLEPADGLVWDCIRECRIRFHLDHQISCLRPFLRNWAVPLPCVSCLFVLAAF